MSALVKSGQTIAGQNRLLSAIVRKRPNHGPGGAAMHALTHSELWSCLRVWWLAWGRRRAARSPVGFPESRRG